ncbi:MAG: ATP-binding cassette domain-containing protein [Oscillospiraceae bacterium]
MEIGDIMAMIEYAVLTLMYLIMGIAVFLFIPRAHTCAKRISAVLEVKPELTQIEQTSQNDSGNAPAAVFQNVTFRYAGAEEAVLHHLDFAIEKGKTTAIIGSTGSGKSTIASLLMRFYDIQEGGILVEGRDIRSYSLEELRDKIGYVPQPFFQRDGGSCGGKRTRKTAWGVPDPPNCGRLDCLFAGRQQLSGDEAAYHCKPLSEAVIYL